MNPAVLIAWVSVVAELIKIGKITYDEVAAIFKSHTHGTDAETSGADDEALAVLQLVIATARAEAAAAAGIVAPPPPV